MSVKSKFPVLRGPKEIIVDVTFDPPWTPDMVTEEGRELLKAIYGYDVVEEWKRRMQEAQV